MTLTHVVGSWAGHYRFPIDVAAFVLASRGHPSQSMSNLAVSRADFERVRQPAALERAESLRAQGNRAYRWAAWLTDLATRRRVAVT